MYLGKRFAKVRNVLQLLRGFSQLKKGNHTKDAKLEVQGAFNLTLAVTALGLNDHLAANFAAQGGAELLASRHSLSDALSAGSLSRYRTEGTLGNALRQQIEAGMDPNFFMNYLGSLGVTPRNDAEYLCFRLSQHHDLFHVVTGYPTNPEGEMSIFMFQAAQTGSYGSLFISLAVAISILVKAPLRLREVADILTHAWHTGRATPPLLPVRYENCLGMPLPELRTRLGIPRDGVWGRERSTAIAAVS